VTSKAMTLADFVLAAKSEITEIDGAQLETMRRDRPGLLLVDVREASEHERCRLEGSMLVPRGVLESASDSTYPKRVQALANARELPVVLYCATGGRSAMAAVTLQRMCFKEVYSLAGGIVRWEAEKRPVSRREEPAREPTHRS
jgi:rhodanese-related sulfurtransferase